MALANASLNHCRKDRHNVVPSHRCRYYDTPADVANDDLAGSDADRTVSDRDHHSLVRNGHVTPRDLCCCCWRYPRSCYYVEVEEVVAFSASRSVWRSLNEIANVVEHDDVPINLTRGRIQFN